MPAIFLIIFLAFRIFKETKEKTRFNMAIDTFDHSSTENSWTQFCQLVQWLVRYIDLFAI